MSQELVLRGTVVYPKFFKPEPVKVGGQPKGDPIFSCQLILDPDTDWGAVNTALAEAVAYKFQNRLTLEQVRLPWHDATEYGFPGQFYTNITSSGDRPPEVYDENVSPTIGVDGRDIRGGHRVAIYARAGAYQNGNECGAKFYMNMVQFLDRNPNLPVLGKTGPDAKTVFQAVPGAPAQLAPTAYSQQQPMQPQPQQYPGQQTPQPQPQPQQPQPQQPQPQPQQYPGAVGNVIPPGAPPMNQPQPGYAPNQAAPGQPPAAPPGPSVGAPPAAGYPSNPPTGPATPAAPPQGAAPAPFSPGSPYPYQE